MPATTIELPLAFEGHVARLVVAAVNGDGWYARAEVDGREIGWQHYTRWEQVERFRSRMQNWLKQAERASIERCREA